MSRFSSMPPESSPLSDVSHPAFRRIDHRPWPLPARPWLGRQSWRDLLFAHWPVPVTRLRAFVPPAVTIQEHGGTSWVGLVPFRMAGVALRPLPDLPGISAFPELNLRLYVEVDGRAGVWFISLDAGNALAVWAARRFFHLPYFRADMHVAPHGAAGDLIRYQSVRRSSGPRVVFVGSYGPCSDVFEAKPGTIEHFLTERYCLYTQDSRGNILRANIHHTPWPLQIATAEIVENTIGDAQGIALAGPPPLLHFSRRQDVVVWPIEGVPGAGKG
jgi:uncharacterized protein YqjF (DUF2071 family)